MPVLHTNLLKMSLLLGLFVFNHACFSANSTKNTWVILWYSLRNTLSFQYLPLFYTYCSNTQLKNAYTPLRCLKLYPIQQNFSKSTLQNQLYSKKHLKNTRKVFKSNLYILKSNQKRSKALRKYSIRRLFSMFQGLFIPFFHLNPTL